MNTDYGHLTYCTNIHPGENWSDHFQQIREHFPSIKKIVSPDRPMGIGLRLSNEVSLDLMHDQVQQTFKSWLEANHAYVFTMNGFPYGGFHRTRVKDHVHSPDWTTRERMDYTVRLFDILKHCLPEGIEGGISTSPLSYRHWFRTADEKQQARTAATNQVAEMAALLASIESGSGRYLHLDIEPEPDGMLETGDEFVDWFEQDLLPAGVTLLKDRYGYGENRSLDLLRRHICLCYDVCHFAIGYESHEPFINRLNERGIRVGKIQISAALKGKLDADPGKRAAIREAFSGFDEPVYLHQVVARKTSGQLLRYRDLPDALADINNPEVQEWRAHYHVPISQTDFGLLQSTRSDIKEVLALQKQMTFSQHMEVETYTWDVLPGRLKKPIQESIIAELDWVKTILDLS
jgi:hypothetical protein